MTTLETWATMTPSQRRESTRRKAQQYAAENEAASDFVMRIAPDYSRPYVANGVWYVRMGTVDMPFSNYGDALEFLGGVA